MSISNEIIRLQNAKSALATSIGNKGVTVPAATKLDGYSALVDQIQTGGGGSPDEEWVRPSNWPDYSKIPMSSIGTDELYMTFDCRPAIRGEEPAGVSFRATAPSGYTVERGYIGDNEFVAVETSSLASLANFQERLPVNEGDYVVYRVKSTGNITNVTLMTWNNYIGDKAYSTYIQPILEMYGKLEHATSLSLRNNTTRSFAVVLKSMTTMGSLFNQWFSLENVDTTDWDTSSVVDMSNLFYLCNRLKRVDVSRWNTSNVTTMAGIFSSNNALSEVDVSRWDTSKVTNMASMFSSRCLNAVGVSNFNTSKVTSMKQMFNSNDAMSVFDLSKWNFSALTDNVSIVNQANSCTFIEFGPTLTRLDQYAFYNLYLCTTYIFHSITPPTMANINAFNNINSEAKIYVPDESVNAYKTATNWSTYASYIYPLSDYTE